MRGQRRENYGNDTRMLELRVQHETDGNSGRLADYKQNAMYNQRHPRSVLPSLPITHISLKLVEKAEVIRGRAIVQLLGLCLHLR